MRRKLSSVARVDPNDRQRRSAWDTPEHDGLQHGPYRVDGMQVVDDFGEVAPFSPRELEVIETYLGALLDALLNGTE